MKMSEAKKNKYLSFRIVVETDDGTFETDMAGFEYRDASQFAVFLPKILRYVTREAKKLSVIVELEDWLNAPEKTVKK